MYYSALLSLIIQIITCFFLFMVFFFPFKKKNYILKDLLYLEIIVQVVEIIFYTWLVYNFNKITYDVTYIRYFDWVISTPFMLLIIIIFMEYLNNINIPFQLKDILNQDYKKLIFIFFSNLFMLLFGFLGEKNILSKWISMYFGLFFLVLTYFMIFKFYVKDNFYNTLFLFINFLIWAIYGYAFIQSYVLKNNIYNILDIFSKNITAFFIFFIVLFSY